MVPGLTIAELQERTGATLARVAADQLGLYNRPLE
jgi:hypothetical protein